MVAAQLFSESMLVDTEYFRADREDFTVFQVKDMVEEAFHRSSADAEVPCDG